MPAAASAARESTPLGLSTPIGRRTPLGGKAQAGRLKELMDVYHVLNQTPALVLLRQHLVEYHHLILPSGIGTGVVMHLPFTCQRHSKGIGTIAHDVFGGSTMS